jgi:hypothetical protein
MSIRTSIAALALSGVAFVAAGAQGTQHADSTKAKPAASAQQAGSPKADSSKAKASTKSQASRHSRRNAKPAKPDSTKHQ